MSSKTIYMAGEYDDGASVSSQFSNGEDVNASGKFSHAEGKNTSSTGEYSHSDGVNPVAKDKYSYVWNGDQSKTVESSGIGTYTVNPMNGLKGFIVDGKSLYELIGEGGGGNILKSNNIFTGTNRFNNMTKLSNTELMSNVTLTNINATINLSAGDVKVATPNITSNDETAASTRFVHKLIQEYLVAVLGNGVLKS